MFFSSKDFDFLQNKETATSLSSAIKDSVLLKFDPLINQPVIVESRTGAPPPTQVVPRVVAANANDDDNGNNYVEELKRNGGGQQQQRQQRQPSKRFSSLDVSGCGEVASSTILVDRLDDEEEDLEQDSLLQVFGVVRSKQAAATTNKTVSGSASEVDRAAAGQQEQQQEKRNHCPISKLVDVTMSFVDVNNDSNLSVESSVINGVVGGGGKQNYNNTYALNTLNNNANNNTANIHNINNGTIGSTINSSRNLSNIDFEDLEFSKSRMSVDGGQQQQQHHHHQQQLSNNHHNSTTTNGEVKIRNERYEDMDRKMKEMEEKEEVLLKRLTEKEKQIAKMGHIVEEYERSIAGLMKDRAITTEEYEKRCLELETERNANYQHLSSLETTFSDLHV